MEYQCEQCGEMFGGTPERYERNVEGGPDIGVTKCECGGTAYQIPDAD